MKKDNNISEPLISVIVPVYNAEKYLDRCVESIINQTYKNLQIILINDGSRDKSGDICNHWASVDKRVVVIHKDNAGVSEARNDGLKIAKGEFISFIDSDDYVDQKLYEFCIKNIGDCDMIVFGYNAVKSKTMTSMHVLDDLIFEESDIEKYVQYADLKGCFTSLWTKLYSNKFTKIKFKQGLQFGEDFLFNVEVIKNCKKIRTINEVFYNYVIYDNANSLSKVNGVSKMLGCAKSETEKLIEIFGEKTWIKERFQYAIFNILRMYIKTSSDEKRKKLKVLEDVCNDEFYLNYGIITKVKGFKRKISRMIMRLRSQHFKYLLLKYL